MDDRETVWQIVAENDLCVLATIGGGQPHCSLMAYVTDPDRNTLYLVTNRDTKKFRNLELSPQVSLLIDTRHRHLPGARERIQAVTLNGTCRAVLDPERSDRIGRRFLEVHPHLRPVFEHPDRVFLEVVIRSLLRLNGPTDALYLEIPPEY